MFRNLLNKIVGDPNEKEIGRLRPIIKQINDLEPTYVWMTSEELRAQTDKLLNRLQRGETLDDILPDAFALVRETAKRTVGMRHFDVQLIGGMVLHAGKVAEMKTGEGKTLVATLPLYLNALLGKGAHLVTVNDYLARYHAVWMGQIYHALGLSVGLLQGSNKSFIYEPGYAKSEFRDLRPAERREAYAAHITYGTNNEFGFDYLRDNLAYAVEEQVQRSLYYAIVDEVDNVFIDEARTPLIISGASQESDEEYRRFARIAPRLEANVDYELDEKTRAVFLTEAGLSKVEDLAGIDNIYDPVNQRYVHYMEQALRAQVLFQDGRDYIRQRDRIVLVDEFTGRLMPDRRLSDGLHQALEAKHGLTVRSRMVTQATITIQNYFRMYPKLAGMTGTALSEAEELHKIYNLDVTPIPTNKPMIRQDKPDVIYRTLEAKTRAILDEIKGAHEHGQPTLVGTTSVDRSEDLSRRLRAEHIEHFVLNAKEHTKEAQIIARAGEPGRVTVATNMAGRGVDIKLGGELTDETIAEAQRVLRKRGVDPFEATPAQFDSAVAEVDPQYALRREQVLAAGGLYVLGTERHEARRIDNQLRGRSGRQGEPGLSRFFLSMEDDLMRRFGGSNVSNLMSRLGVEDDIPIEFNLISKSVESAQTRIEGYNFDIRKHLLEYDDVLNQQREIIYRQRQRILTKDDLWPDLWGMIDGEIERRQAELAKEPGRAWELVNAFDAIMPLNYAPVALQKGSKGKRSRTAPGAALAYEAMRYPYTLSPVRSTFLPLSISFIAQTLAGEPGPARAATLLKQVTRALEIYREYLMQQAVHETFASASKRYDEGWEQQRDELEARIHTYEDTLDGRERVFDPREMLDQVQRGLPVRINVSSADLAKRGPDDVRKLIETSLEQSYHLSTCDQLVRRVAGQTPANLGLASATIDLVSPEEAQRFLERAALKAYSDGARQELLQMANREAVGKTRTDRSLWSWLARALSLARIELTELENLLAGVLVDQYAAWSERTLAEISERAGGKPSADDPTAVGQWLVDVLALVDQQTFHVAWRVPASFLVLAFTDGMSDDERVAALREHLERCITERQMVWGQAELTQRGHLKLKELGPAYVEALARYWGRRLIGGSTLEIAALTGEQSDALARLVTVYDLRALQLGAWPMFGQIVQRLGETIEGRLQPASADADRYLLDAAEAALQEQGWFDDPEAEGRFLAQKLEDLSRPDRDSIASAIGEGMLMGVRTQKISELEPALRQRVLNTLKARGRFVDEAQVQDFLLHRRLNDLAPEHALAACRQVVLEQWEPLRSRTIGELESGMRERILAGLRQGGFIWDAAARARVMGSRLGDLEPAALDAVARVLGMEEWPSAQPAGALDAIRRPIARARMDAAGLFLKRDEYENFRLSSVSALPTEGRDALRQHLWTRIGALLAERPGKDLPRALHARARRGLEEAGYFLDARKVAQWEQRALSSFDGKTMSALERSIGRATLAGVDKRPFTELDKSLRDSILAYLDRENIYRKSARRRAFMQSQLSELDTALYDGIAQHLGHAALQPLRGQPIGQLPANIQSALQSQKTSAGELIDPDKVSSFEQNPLESLPAEARQAVLKQLAGELDGLLAGKGEGAELYEGMLLDARQYLAQRGHFTLEDADERFAALRPEILEPTLRDDIYRALGRRVLEPALAQRPDEAPAGLRERILDALGRAGAFVDREKEGAFLRSRLQDLTPDVRDAIINAWAQNVQREISGRAVAELDDGTRQAVRAYLDDSDYFVSPALIQTTEGQALAELRREDWQALALAGGLEALERQRGRAMGELPAELRSAALIPMRRSGRFLDEARRASFRQGGLSSAPADVRAGVLERVRQADQQRLNAALWPNLPAALRWEIERYGVDAAEPADYKRMRVMEKQSLSDLDADLYDAFLRYLGFPYVLPLEDVQLSNLPAEERQIVCEFLGDRVALEIQKRVMLSYVSRLWIDYLTDMEDLRQGIGLEAFGQRDPLVEYKRRAYTMFHDLMDEIRQGIVSRVFALEPIALP